MNIKSIGGSIRYCSIMILCILTVMACGDDEPTAPDAVRGCTNSAADNYNSNATVDDGSCEISGCMDSAAENFNPDATKDDGMCVFPKDKFIGTYLGGFECPGLFAVINEDSVAFEISEPVDVNEKAKVTISFVVTGIPISLEADVDGNMLTFSEIELNNIPFEVGGLMVDADLTFSGGAEIDGNTLTATIQVQAIAAGLTLSEECVLTGVKN